MILAAHTSEYAVKIAPLKVASRWNDCVNKEMKDEI
jgi:hypothetical protein